MDLKHKVMFEVTDVNQAASSVLLEGYDGDLKYILMVDYELKDKPDFKHSDRMSAIFTRVAPKKKAKAISTATLAKQMQRKKMKKMKTVPQQKIKNGGFCLGSGEQFPVQNRYMHLTCNDCGKSVHINRDGTMRKHTP